MGGSFLVNCDALDINIWLLTWAPVWNDVLWHKTPNHPGRTSTCPLCGHGCNLHIVFGTTPAEPSKIPSYCRFCAQVRLFPANVIRFIVPCVTEGRESSSHRLRFDDGTRAGRQQPMFQHRAFSNSQRRSPLAARQLTFETKSFVCPPGVIHLIKTAMTASQTELRSWSLS